MRWEDVDLDKGTLSVRYALQRVDGKVELVEPKTKKSRRTIALPSVAVNALLKHRITQESERQRAVIGGMKRVMFSPAQSVRRLTIATSRISFSAS